MDDAELKKARFYALKVLNARPRSVEELAAKLSQKGYPEEIRAQVIGECTKKGLLDDVKFAKLWVQGRMASRPKGGAVLRRELEEKGVKEDVIEKVVAGVAKEYDEYEVAKGLAGQRIDRLKGLNKTTAKRRLFGFLRRRGFSFDTIIKVMDELL